MKATTILPALVSILFLSLSLFYSPSLFAQELGCGTIAPAGYIPERIQHPIDYQQFLRDFKKQKQNRMSCINYAPIKAHIVRRSNGTGGLTEAQLNDAIDTMNVYYADACMAFYLCGAVHYIDDDIYYDFDKEPTEEDSLLFYNQVDDLINIYFCNSVTSPSGALCGYASFPGGLDRIMMRNSCTINGSTLSHEMGHFFALPHTHQGGNELVDGSNCADAGDSFCDTPADPTLSGKVNSNCDYTGTGTDANGDFYMPNTRNFMSYSTKACRDEFSTEQIATIAYVFLNVRNYWACPDFDVDFTSDLTSSCTFPVTANFTEMALGETSYEWDFDNDGIFDDTTSNPSYSYPSNGTYDVRLKVSNGTFDISKVKTAYIKIGSRAYPYTQNMETFTAESDASGYEDDWIPIPANTVSAYRWNTSEGTTPSSNTGPDGDHTQADGSGIYAFTEATGAAPGDVAELISPCIEVPAASASVDYFIRFWYHMYGSQTGELHIDLHDGSNWVNDIAPAIIGQQQTASSDPFIEKTVDINAYAGQSIKIRFRGIRGVGFQSDIAIDDFEVFNLGSLPVTLSEFSGVNLSGGKHLLAWETASEQNSDHFMLEHSMDGIRFAELTQISAKGQSSSKSSYQFINSSPQSGVNYYRLKMVDHDGSFTYSLILPLRSRSSVEKLSLFPNPGKGHYQIELANRSKDISYQVYNTFGQSILNGTWSSKESALSLDLSTQANGVYLLQIREGGQLIATQRFIKQ